MKKKNNLGLKEGRGTAAGRERERERSVVVVVDLFRFGEAGVAGGAFTHVWHRSFPEGALHHLIDDLLGNLGFHHLRLFGFILELLNQRLLHRVGHHELYARRVPHCVTTPRVVRRALLAGVEGGWIVSLHRCRIRVGVERVVLCDETAEG